MVSNSEYLDLFFVERHNKNGDNLQIGVQEATKRLYFDQIQYRFNRFWSSILKKLHITDIFVIDPFGHKQMHLIKDRNPRGNNMTMNRTGEAGNCPGRSGRFFQKADYWYYTTREGVDIGPFDSASEAETGVSDFIDFIIHAEPRVIESLEKYGRAA